MQEELERALSTVLRRPATLTVAGRTDRGVHAWAQVASYEGPVAAPRALNALLPPEIAVLRCEEAPDGFDARRDALSRTYCFRVLDRRERGVFEAGRALWWPHRVDEAALHECARLLCGRHDFTAFTPAQTEHVFFEREILRAAWMRREGLLEFWIEADAFMRHMNRILVATMLDVAGGRRSIDDFAALLEGRPRAEAGVTAPAHGLFFAGARYDPPAFA